jgi:5-methylcytosine-specific restriction endonuclease McrA
VFAHDTPRIYDSLCTLARHSVGVTVNRSRRARAARRRKRRLNAVDNDLTAAQWAAIKDAWNGCAYCGATDGALQKDCVMALSRGGRYTIDNVVPACASCNTSKCNDEVTAWMRRKRLDERTFLERYIAIRAALAEAGRAASAR